MTTETSSAAFPVGALIRHPDLPDAREVLDVRPCCAGVSGVEPHVAYIVPDRPWGDTWVCSRDAVRMAS